MVNNSYQWFVMVNDNDHDNHGTSPWNITIFHG